MLSSRPLNDAAAPADDAATTVGRRDIVWEGTILALVRGMDSIRDDTTTPASGDVISGSGDGDAAPACSGDVTIVVGDSGGVAMPEGDNDSATASGVNDGRAGNGGTTDVAAGTVADAGGMGDEDGDSIATTASACGRVADGAASGTTAVAGSGAAAMAARESSSPCDAEPDSRINNPP
jgi:hypothetical protein